MSTTNRFPIISPQAKITPHGYFADAGYYENSGMLSQYKLYQYLKKQTGWDTLFRNRKVVFIQIMNTTNSYLNDKIEKREENIKELADASEVKAIVKTMIELNSTPFLINRTIKTLGPNVAYVPIALPFPIEEDDVKSFLGAEELMPSSMSQFCCYNSRINKIRLEEGSLWETTFPSTSRLVVNQSSKYMLKCLEDGIVFQELDEFFEK